MEDLKQNFPEYYYKLLKSAIKTLIKDGLITRIQPGIYSLSSQQVSQSRITKEQYLVRNGKRIGIYDSKSLAYEMGLTTEKPKILYLMTNKESQPHGRRRVINGQLTHIRGNSITIDDDNYQYIMALEAIKFCWHYSSRYENKIPQFIKEHNLSLDVFLSLLPFYSQNVNKRFTRIWKQVLA